MEKIQHYGTKNNYELNSYELKTVQNGKEKKENWHADKRRFELIFTDLEKEIFRVKDFWFTSV